MLRKREKLAVFPVLLITPVTASQGPAWRDCAAAAWAALGCAAM